MGQRCKTCDHPDREEIETALLNNETYRSIGERFGLSHLSVLRHYQNGHIAAAMIQGAEIKRIAYSEDLLDKLKYLQHESLKVLLQAKDPEEGPPLLTVVLSAIGRAVDMIKVQGTLAGQLKTLEVNFLINPMWINLKQQIFKALEPFPDARKSMMEVMENEGLSDIQRSMLTPEQGTEPLSPEILAIINREFEEEPHEQNLDRLTSEIYEKKRAEKSRPSSQRKYRCIKEHSWHGKIWQVGQVWDSRDPDGPAPPAGSEDWELFNPADEIPDRLMPTRR